MPGSNRRPLPCEGSALPAAPIAHLGMRFRSRRDRGFDTSRRRCAIAHRRAARARIALLDRRHARVFGTDWRHDRPRRVIRSARFVIRSPNPLESLCRRNSDNADVAQLVAHHLAKVRVASSSLVIRSDQQGRKPLLFVGGEPKTRWIGREARQRPAKPYTRVRIPYPPPSLRTRILDLGDWRSGSALP